MTNALEFIAAVVGLFTLVFIKGWLLDYYRTKQMSRAFLEAHKLQRIEAGPSAPRDADWEHVFELEAILYPIPWHHGQFPELATVELTERVLIGGGPPDWWDRRRLAMINSLALPEADLLALTESEIEWIEEEEPDLSFGRQQYLETMQALAEEVKEARPCPYYASHQQHHGACCPAGKRKRAEEINSKSGGFILPSGGRAG